METDRDVPEASCHVFDNDDDPELTLRCRIDRLNPHELPFLREGTYVSINVYDTEGPGHLDTVFYKVLWTADEIAAGNLRAAKLKALFANAVHAPPDEGPYDAS